MSVQGEGESLCVVVGSGKKGAGVPQWGHDRSVERSVWPQEAHDSDSAPHCAQKLAIEAFRCAQTRQATGAGAPHLMQNLAASGRPARQVRHGIRLASQFETSFPEAPQS